MILKRATWHFKEALQNNEEGKKFNDNGKNETVKQGKNETVKEMEKEMTSRAGSYRRT